MKKKLKVAGWGELLWDVFENEKRLGGAPVNFARHVQQLGIDSYPISCVGGGPLGCEARDDIAASGVNVDFLFEHPSLFTGVVKVTLDEHGKPDYQIADNVAWDQIHDSLDLVILAKELDAICFGTLSQRSGYNVDSLGKLLDEVPDEALKILDVNLRTPYFSKHVVTSSLELANVLKLSDEELPVLADYYDLPVDETDQLRALIAKFELRLIAYTKGADGSVLVTPDQVDVAQAVPVTPIDSVGAGDSFTAALCVGLLHGFPLSDCNQFANRVAAFVCSHQGACPTLPDELRNYSKTHSAIEPS